MSAKSQSIWTIILAAGLIFFSVYTINNFSKDASKSTFSKIVVDVLGVFFVIAGIGAIVVSAKQLSA